MKGGKKGETSMLPRSITPVLACIVFYSSYYLYMLRAESEAKDTVCALNSSSVGISAEAPSSP